MSAAVDRYRDELLRLSAQERHELVAFLISSVDEEIYGPFDPPDIVEAEWNAELKRRIDDLKSGKTKTIPGEQVMDELKKMFP